MKPVSLFQLHWGWSREKAFPAFPDARVSSVFACVDFLCVFLFGFLLLLVFFLNKEKKMCIFLATTET